MLGSHLMGKAELGRLETPDGAVPHRQCKASSPFWSKQTSFWESLPKVEMLLQEHPVAHQLMTL